MAIFVCTECSHTQEAPDAYIGRAVKCLKCESRGEIIASKLKPMPPSPHTTPPPESKPPDVPEKSGLQSGPPFSRTDSRIIICLLAALLVAQVFGLTSTKTSATQWEYTIESPGDIAFEMSLNHIGDEGWELVFARRATSEYGSPSYEMIFKRPKR